MMLPLTALAALVTWKFLPLKPVVGDWKAKAAALDYLGAVLTFIATTLLVVSSIRPQASEKTSSMLRRSR